MSRREQMQQRECTKGGLFDHLVGAGDHLRWHVERDSQYGPYVASHQPHYSGLMPASLITLAHFSVSSAMNLPNFAGVIGVDSTPKVKRRAFKSGAATPAVLSLLSLSMIVAGVPVGAQMPYQPLAA